MALKLNDNPTNKVIDPHNFRGRHKNWKAKGCPLDVSKVNREILLEYLEDMEEGKNTSGRVKGGRSYIRLTAMRTRISQLANFFEEEYNKSIVKITRDEVTSFFNKLDRGEIKKKDGKPYQSYSDFVRDIKGFWHWYMKSRKRNGKVIEDVTDDIGETTKKPPKFVYFTEQELQKMLDMANLKYKALMIFLFDSCIRAPTEASNVKVSDLQPIKNSDLFLLQIRDETSKTVGRKIKLMLSSRIIKRYINANKLEPNDFLFKITPRIVNQHLKRLGIKAIGKEPTMYDFRHCGICYWMPRYKHESALRYRTGHKDSKMLDYYSQFLGMKDTIDQTDLDDVDTRTELQKQVEEQRKELEMLKEQIQNQQKDFIKALEQQKHFMESVNRVKAKINSS